MKSDPTASSQNSSIYVSLTGLKLKKPWHIFTFYRYAIPAFSAAKKSEGNIKAEVKTVKGVHHTLTIWQSRKHMLEYVYGKTHKKAIAAFDRIATGKTYGYEAKAIPSWDEALMLLEKNGRIYASRK